MEDEELNNTKPIWSSSDKQSDVEITKNDREKLAVATELKLEVRATSSLQYVRWDVFKKQFESKVMDLWFWVRPGRGKNLIFLTKGGEKPHIDTAISLRNLQESTHLPSLVSECIRVSQVGDREQYTALESNGTVWTVASLLSIKGGKQFDFTTDCNEYNEKKEKVYDGSTKISLIEPVQRLPAGQSLITVVEGPTQRAMMQVKLPPTLPSQYWSLESVERGQSSIQFPDSTPILQQAATLSTATSTIVRIPIPVGDQDPSFGVYAVPGLKSHVFVGPFASNEVVKETIVDADEFVCQVKKYEMYCGEEDQTEDAAVCDFCKIGMVSEELVKEHWCREKKAAEMKRMAQTGERKYQPNTEPPLIAAKTWYASVDQILQRFKLTDYQLPPPSMSNWMEHKDEAKFVKYAMPFLKAVNKNSKTAFLHILAKAKWVETMRGQGVTPMNGSLTNLRKPRRIVVNTL